MQPPDDANELLRSLLRTGPQFKPDDVVTIKRMLEGMEAGGRGMVIFQHPDGRTEFLFANATRPEAIVVLCEVIARNAKAITEGG